MFTHFFVKRPIFSTVIALVIFCLGVVTYSKLPVEQFPNVTPPTVTVEADWPGASAEDVVDSVAVPIEEKVNGVDRMLYMESKSTSNGKYLLTVTFQIGTDPDMATTLVQNRVNQATASLPAAVTQIGVTTEKKSSNIVVVVNLFDRIQQQAEVRRLEEARKKSQEELEKELLAEGLEEHEIKQAAEAAEAARVGDRAAEEGGGGFFAFLFGKEPTVRKEAKEDEWRYDAQHRIVNQDGRVYEPRPSIYLANYAKNYLKNDLARLPGVGGVSVYDTQDYSMRIWLDNDILAARDISATDITQMIAEQNQMVSAGRIGAEPIPAGQRTNIVLTTKGRLTNVSEFENMILRTDEQGRTLHLKDVARIELGKVSYLTKSSLNGMPATTIGIMQTPGANAIDVAETVRAKLAEMEPEFIARNLDCQVSYDSTRFVEVSIDEVKNTLIEAVFIVIFVVYVFLQNWRAAIIPTLTVPVSLVGAFFLMMLFGFTLNTLTLFGLVLVIGIVVDDSILVVENTQRILDEEPDLSPYQATKKSMIEMASPVIGTTVVLMAVFIPTAMISGMIGQLYKQFALTIAGAIGISGVCALTFAPALSCVLLRSDKRESKPSFFAGPMKLLGWAADTALATVFILMIAHMFDIHMPRLLVVASAAVLFCPFFLKSRKPFFFVVFNTGFDLMNRGYVFLMTHLAKAAFIVLILWGGLVYGLYEAFSVMPTSFLPEEDQGVLFFEATLPEGASDERTGEVMKQVDDILNMNRAGIKNIVLITGNSMLQGMNAVNAGMGFIVLEDWNYRQGPGLSAEEIQERLMRKLSVIPEADIFVFAPPPIYGIGTSGGLELRVLDKAQFGSVALAEAGEDVVTRGIENQSIIFGKTLFNPAAPRCALEIDREKVKKLFLSMDDVFKTLSTMVGSAYVNDFNEFGQVYRVTVQSSGKYRDDINPILDIQVRNANGNMVPFRSFATARDVMGPEIITRYNLFQTTPITAVVMPGKSSGEAIASMEEVCRQLPDGFGFDWTGMTFQEKSVGADQYVVFAMSILFAFLILSALYESWSSPIIIMMAVPLGVMGALIAVALFGMSINMYTQVGLIIMVGLSAKNAILITEVSRELRIDHGMSLRDAAVTAGNRRMRPIMMTSYAFILGVIPLAVASGAGALGRNAIGRAVCGGMLNETMIGIFVTPALFILFQSYSEWFAAFLKRVIGETGNDGS